LLQWSPAAKPGRPNQGARDMAAILPILIFVVAVAAINFLEFHRID
jgi:hypothetical protein